MPSEKAGEKERLIILVHGIRDPGFWQDDLKAHFEHHPVTSVVTAKTDVVDLFRFLSPIVSMRERPVARIKSVIENAIAANKNAEVTIIAHSFGTWMVSQILHEDTNIAIDRLILCGAIVPNDFRWDRVLKINLNGRKNAIVNEYSPLDVWPLSAKVMTYGYGNVGSRGIGDSGIADRRHWIPHSGYLNVEFARKFWDPFIFQDKIVGADTQPARAPWYFFLTRVPVNYMSVALAAGAIFLAAIGYYWLNNVGNLDIAILSFKRAQIRTAGGGLETRVPEFRFTNKKFNLEVFQYFDQVSGEQLKAHSLAAADNLKIEVSNRPPIRCDDDGSEIAWTDHRTTYEIEYQRQSWWRNIRDFNWKGTVEFELSYDPGNREAGKLDLLKIESAKGVAPGTRIFVTPTHNPDNCRDAGEQDSMYVVPAEFTATTPSGIWSWLAGISVANAADKVGATIKEFLNSRDRTSRSIAVQNIQRNPEVVKGEFSELIDPAASVNQVSDVLTGLVNSGDPGVIFSPEVLDPVFQLTWNDDAGKRAVARRFLSTEFVARTNVTPRFKQAIKDHWDELVGHYVHDEGDPFSEKRYLALIALRDVYYNGALFRFDRVVDLGAAGKIDDEIEAVVGILSQGEDIAEMADPRTRYAFAKNTYGRALSLLRYARVKQALADGVAAKDPSAANILANLKRYEDENRPLRLDQFRGQEAYDAFVKFLQEIAGNEERYIWPHHIAQARACTALPDAMPAGCLNATE